MVVTTVRDVKSVYEGEEEEEEEIESAVYITQMYVFVLFLIIILFFLFLSLSLPSLVRFFFVIQMLVNDLDKMHRYCVFIVHILSFSP